MLLPSAGVVYNAALVGSSAAAFSAVDAPLLYLLLTLLAAAAVLARGEMLFFCSYSYSPPPSLLKSIGHGAAQARPSAQNSPVYATQAPFCLCFAGVWSGPVLYKNQDWPPTGHSLILSVERVKRPPPCNRNHPRTAPGLAFIYLLGFRGRETK